MKSALMADRWQLAECEKSFRVRGLLTMRRFSLLTDHSKQPKIG